MKNQKQYVTHTEGMLCHSTHIQLEIFIIRTLETARLFLVMFLVRLYSKKYKQQCMYVGKSTKVVIKVATTAGLHLDLTHVFPTTIKLLKNSIINCY